MPDLPTITVTAEQQARILEAYKDVFGTTTQAETIAAYKKMLANMVRGEVLSYEQRKAHAQIQTDVDTFMTGV